MLTIDEVSVSTPRSAVHPDAVTLAAYLDRRLPDEARCIVAEHLISCDSCRETVSDVSRVAGAAARRRRAIATASAISGLAAILVLVTLPDRAAVPPPPESPIERSASPGRIGTIHAWSSLSPLPDGDASSAVALLAWSPVVPGSRYRVTVTDSVGDEVWASSTADTIARLPESLRLAANAEYFWVVDALLPDGATATSGIRQLPPAR